MKMVFTLLGVKIKVHPMKMESQPLKVCMALIPSTCSDMLRKVTSVFSLNLLMLKIGTLRIIKILDLSISILLQLVELVIFTFSLINKSQKILLIATIQSSEIQYLLLNGHLVGINVNGVTSKQLTYKNLLITIRNMNYLLMSNGVILII